MKSKRYPNLYQLNWSPNWVFRKYSSVKRKEFVASTGILAREEYAARAYKIGLERFDTWLGTHLPSGRPILFRDLARVVLASKEATKGAQKGSTYRSAKNQILNHLIPAFGHLRPEQISSMKWEQYCAEERARVYETSQGHKYQRTALANSRKYLIEIMRRAYDEKLIERVPQFKKDDPESEPPRYLSRAQVRAFFHHANPRMKLLAFLMWKQGPRPSEALQYRFSMIDFTQGEYGLIRIPGEITKNGTFRAIPLNSRVSRILKWLQARTATDCLFPSLRHPDEPMREYGKSFKRALIASRLREYIPYNFRDTAITNMLKRGLSSTFVGKYVQSSAEMIDRKYAVAEQDILRKVAQ